LLVAGVVGLLGCDNAGPSSPDSDLTGAPDVVLSQIVTEIKGITNTDPDTPIELYGESFAVVNNATVITTDSTVLYLDGDKVAKVESKRDIRAELPADQFTASRHTLTLTGFKTLNGKTRSESARRQLTFN
jgi:hypothetical protein